MAFASITGAITGTIKVMKELYDYTLEYGDSVRQLSMLSGTTAEDASRLIQVADDYKVSVQDITLASKQMAKDGISPTVESMALLSDQYLALSTADEKEAFLMSTFGARGGIAFIEMMNAGGDAIRASSDAVSQNNIDNQTMLDLQRQNEIAVGNVSDAFNGLKNVMGNWLIGPATAFENWLASSLEGWGQFVQYMNYVFGGNWKPTVDLGNNNFSKGRLPIPQASGGNYLVDQPTMFMAGEAGPELASFTPQDQLEQAGGGMFDYDRLAHAMSRAIDMNKFAMAVRDAILAHTG
jgi:hypothetical protein